MPTIVDFPTIVKDAVDVFGDLFAHEPARRHFAEYLTGLMVAEKKTVSGINGTFVVTTDQSCLNRWLNEVTWDVKALNDRRLAWLQSDPKTRYSPRGVIAIDNTLVDHAGKLIEDVGWFWDHANERYVIAHDDLISNDVCPSGAHYPIAWRRFKKKDACQKGEFTDHTERCIELINDAITRAIPGDFTFDSYCTSAKVLNHMQSTQRAYVGDLKLNRKLVYDGREQSLQAVARQIPWQAKKPVRVGNRRSWYFSKQMRIPDVTHPVRIILFWKERDDAEAVVGGNTHGVGVSAPLDRHRDISSGREAGVGPGRLPGAQRRGADPPRVSRQRSVQSSDAFAPPEPSAGLGSDSADDHRRSLSGGQRRTPGAVGRLDCGQARR
jgi:hypothetical protein